MWRASGRGICWVLEGRNERVMNDQEVDGLGSWWSYGVQIVFLQTRSGFGKIEHQFSAVGAHSRKIASYTQN